MANTMTEAAGAPFYIADANGAVLRAWCAGPGADGRCPAAIPGRPVPCAGYELILACPETHPQWKRAVPSDQTVCPIPVTTTAAG